MPNSRNRSTSSMVSEYRDLLDLVAGLAGIVTGCVSITVFSNHSENVKTKARLMQVNFASAHGTNRLAFVFFDLE